MASCSCDECLGTKPEASRWRVGLGAAVEGSRVGFSRGVGRRIRRRRGESGGGVLSKVSGVAEGDKRVENPPQTA